ncbi:uncharacterized protein LOC110986146 [Acanthaster planci]|uniref:Uncharacterized protein LOC110986146 n=1 Tax=Acanthaster planci TaxID=133434 RepID=A0A8B7ZCU0_ACAPL|nr:uncharacterized protein LOC110986146 [Acanthaster planci]
MSLLLKKFCAHVILFHSESDALESTLSEDFEEYILLDEASIEACDTRWREMREDCGGLKDERHRRPAEATDSAWKETGNSLAGGGNGGCTNASDSPSKAEVKMSHGALMVTARRKEAGTRTHKKCQSRCPRERCTGNDDVEVSDCGDEDSGKITADTVDNDIKRAPSETCQIYTPAPGIKVRLIQVQPANQLTANQLPIIRPSNPVRSPQSTNSTSQVSETPITHRSADDGQPQGALGKTASPTGEELQGNLPKPKTFTTKHINPNLGILSSRALKRRVNPPKRQKDLPTRSQEPSSQENCGKTENTLVKKEVSPAERDEESRRRQLNASIIAKIQEESCGTDRHAAVEPGRPADGAVHKHTAVTATPAQPTSLRSAAPAELVTLPPTVLEALTLEQEKGRQLLEKTRQQSKMMMNCLMRQRELRKVDDSANHSRPHPGSDSAVGNSQQPSDIMACADRMVATNDMFRENIQNQMIASHNAWMMLKRRKGMFFAAKRKQDHEGGSLQDEKTANQRCKGVPSDQPRVISNSPGQGTDDLVLYKGKLLKLCWPHPKDTILATKTREAKELPERSNKKRKKNSIHPVAATLQPFSSCQPSEDELDYMYRAQLQLADVNSGTCQKTPAPNSNLWGVELIPSGTVFADEFQADASKPPPSNPLVWAYETLQDPKRRRRPRLKNLQRVVDASKHRTTVQKIKSTRPGPDEVIYVSEEEF